MPAPLIRPEHPALRRYQETLRSFSSASVEHESALRLAFQSLLEHTARQRSWLLIPENPIRLSSGKTIRPDGTIQDDFKLHRGYWEAKDTNDDLALEIRRKLAAGYPSTNILFEDTRSAVLIQNGRQSPACDLRDNRQVADTLNSFYSWDEPHIADFERAVTQFKLDVKSIGEALAEKIRLAHLQNARFENSFTGFYDLCQGSINPNIRREAVDEMLVQHLLTERLIRRVFELDDFDRRNVIAVEVENVIDALASTAFNRSEFTRSLDRYYTAIERASATLPGFLEKQHFLNTIYERFFQGYCVRTADTHGIVYTPQEIVRYMLASVARVLDSEFALPLDSPNNIFLDPCTGTGNFVVQLLKDLPRKNIQRMYAQQIFANEVMLMPYYVASLNIERTYYEITGEHLPFQGLCFCDTLDLREHPQGSLFSLENSHRVDHEIEAPVNIIIGNPPYNVGQQNENDNNKNRKYLTVDQRVRETYAKDSTATNKNALADVYVKFFRWATDRLRGKDGILCFVSNNSFVDQLAFDGMRRHLAQDFHLIEHIDLHGNVRQNPKLSGTTHNVFGIQVGVGITLAVRRANSPRRIQYHRAPEFANKREKLILLEAGAIPLETLRPDARHTWLVPENASQFSSFDSIKDLFDIHSRGVQTTRDDVVYDFQRDALVARVKDFMEAYNGEVDRYARAGRPEDVDAFVNYEQIKWSRDLKLDLKRGHFAEFREDKIRNASYRPFAKRVLFFDRLLNEEVYRLPEIMRSPNLILAITDVGSEKPFMALAVEDVPDLHLVGAGASCQCFPLSHLSDSGLNRFRTFYQSDGITKREVFQYLYAVLHHPHYRERFAANLKKELPRIPFAPGSQAFDEFSRIGAELMELHVNYESVGAFPLQWVENPDVHLSLRVEGEMKLSKDKCAVLYNESLTLKGVPPQTFDYKLGNRSALEWIIDQYQLKRSPDGAITSDPNRADDPEYILNLIGRVITVSLETIRLVSSLPPLFEPD